MHRHQEPDTGKRGPAAHPVLLLSATLGKEMWGVQWMTQACKKLARSKKRFKDDSNITGFDELSKGKIDRISIEDD